MKKPKRKYTRRAPVAEAVEPFVVYVRFPSSMKEYAYLCTIPGICQGDQVVANGTTVTVHRTASRDPIACRFVQRVPNFGEVQNRARQSEIVARLKVLDRQQADFDDWAKLAKRNAEAKKLFTELRKLTGAA